MTDPWWKSTVFYQVYPRSFKDSNDDGIGDLPGIISRLDYLADLGVTALWISPFYPSPMEDFGYDISDYCGVDPVFGSLKDACRLIDEAHRRKIRIIIDLVINHTSDRHPWFVEARSSRDNPKHDWYLWKPMHKAEESRGKRLRKPNNWICQFELKSAWWENRATDEWYLATFTRHQPEVNWRNPELKKAMFDVIRFWLELGVDGFRMDVVNWYVKDEQFRSNPFSFKANPDIFQKHIHDRNRPETHAICREIRQFVDSWPGDRVLVGEIFIQNPAEAASYQGNGQDELHLAFNMEMLYLPWNARDFAKAIERWYAVIPKGGWPNFTFSNHDQRRHASRLGSKDATEHHARMQIVSMLLLTIRGTPFLYYGEEIGMINARIPRNELRDPTGKTFWPLPFGRDGQRSPMQWNSGENAGFTGSGVRPWLRVAENYLSANVEAERQEPESLWHWYHTLISLRASVQALSVGGFSFISKGHDGVLSFSRTGADASQTVNCYLNFTTKERYVEIPAEAQVLLGNQRAEGEKLGKGDIPLAPHEALLVSF